MACTCEPEYGYLCKECRLADDAYEVLEQRDDTYGYLSRLFRYYAPQCESLPTLPGLAMQIDNLLVGMAAQRDELLAALRTVIREWEREDVSVITINAARAAVATAEGRMRDSESLKPSLQQGAERLLERNTRWLTSPPLGNGEKDTVAAAALLRDFDRLVRGLLALLGCSSSYSIKHTCHDMNPPFPGPCLACAREKAEAK